MEKQVEDSITDQVLEAVYQMEKMGLNGLVIAEDYKDSQLYKAIRSLITRNDGMWPAIIPVKYREHIDKVEDSAERLVYITALLFLEIERLQKGKPKAGW